MTAGDGLGAFGAALILAVQAHYGVGKAAVLQWICSGVSDPQPPQMSKRKSSKSRPEHLQPAQPREQAWASTLTKQRT
jgi:transposase